MSENGHPFFNLAFFIAQNRLGGPAKKPKYAIPETIATPSDGANWPSNLVLVISPAWLNNIGITVESPRPEGQACAKNYKSNTKVKII